MRLTPVAGGAETVAPFLKPSKIYTIDWDESANTTTWGTTISPGVTASSATEQVLYTAPSTVKYAFPHFPHQNTYNNNNADLANMFQSSSTDGYYYFSLKIFKFWNCNGYNPLSYCVMRWEVDFNA